MRMIGFLLALLGVAAFWIWFLVIRESDSMNSALILRRAKMDIVAACNRALTMEGRRDRFAIEDVRTTKLTESDDGVHALVSMLDVSHGALHCHWGGESAAQISIQ